MYSVIIPTRRPVEKIIETLYSISLQTHQPQRIFILIDRQIDKQYLSNYRKKIIEKIGTEAYKKILLISNIDSSFKPNLGVSYVRNHGVLLVNTPLVLMVDDDNTFDTDFCARLSTSRKELKKITKKSSILIPTEKYKGQIRSRGYRKFCYALGVQKPVHTRRYNRFKKKTIHKDNVFPIKFSSSNCLFGPTKIFVDHPFDERMEFIYEDMDMTQRISKSGYQMYVMLDLFINHQMREKSSLDATYIGTEKDAYQKARNRIIMVKNSAVFEQKLLYFLMGLWIHNIFLRQKIIRLAPKHKKRKLLDAIRKGTRDGILGRY